MMTRLFVALKIPDEVKRKIYKFKNDILPEWGKYKWESEEKIHLTLKFIGEVKDNLIDEIANSLNFIENYPKFNCQLSRFGFFFKRGTAKILWIGLSIDNSLYKLTDEIENKLEQFSIPKEERKFKSHITLLRLKDKEPESFIKAFENFNIPETYFIADEAALVKSELLPWSSRYTEIKKYQLK